MRGPGLFIGHFLRPHPPFDTGSPKKAGAALTSLFTTATKPIFQPLAEAAVHMLAQRPAR